MKGDIWDELTDGRLKYFSDRNFDWSGSFQGIYYDLYFGKDLSQTKNIKVNAEYTYDDQGVRQKKGIPKIWEKEGGKQLYYGGEFTDI